MASHVHLLLNQLNATLLNCHHLLGYVALLLKQLIQHVVAAGALFEICSLLSVNLVPDLYLVGINIEGLLLLLPEFLLIEHLLDLELILYLFELLIVLSLLPPLQVLLQIVLFDLAVSHELLLLDHPLDALPLLALFPSQVLLVAADDLKVVQVVLLRLLLRCTVIFHLLLQFLLHSLLVLANTCLNCILLLLELLNIVHDNLGPIVRVL